MVIIDPIERLDMQRDAGIHGESLKKFAHEVRVEFADLAVMEGRAEDEEGASGHIQRDTRQRLVHRQQAIGIAGDATQITKRLTDRLAEHNARIFHRVMLINVQVALGFDLDVDEAVTGDLVEHVIEEADTGLDRSLSRSVKIDGRLDLGFARLARKGGATHGFCP